MKKPVTIQEPYEDVHETESKLVLTWGEGVAPDVRPQARRSVNATEWQMWKDVDVWTC